MYIVTRAIALAALLATSPAVARAADETSRTLRPAGSTTTIVAATLGTLLAVFTVATLGWLYEQRRGLHWPFQDADAPHPEGEAHH